MAGFFDRLAKGSLFLALRGARREIVALRRVLEIGVDSYRQVNGLPPVFLPLELPALEDLPKADKFAVDLSDRFQDVWFIQELAKEFNIPLTGDVDLVAVAMKQGWMSPDGQIIQLPKSAAGLSMDTRGRG